MENSRNRINLKLVDNKRDYLKCTSKSSYMSNKIFGHNSVAICILELSKVLMYEFHYDYIKNKRDNKSKLIFTDTGSLMYEIEKGIRPKVK